MARYHSSWITKHYGKACQQPLERISFAGSALTIHRKTVAVWRALEVVFRNHHYAIHPPFPTGDTGAYNCRQVTGGTAMSPHSWGIAADINWLTNPYTQTPNRRKVNWFKDTDMTPALIEDVRRITTTGGQRAVFWGGDWVTIKDAMHFQVIVTPTEIASGIIVPGGNLPTTWRQPGDPILTMADAKACLLYQGGLHYWNPLFTSGSDEAVMKTADLANRAMVLQGAVDTVYATVKDLAL